MLGVVEKVALAGGVGGMPLQDIEVRIARHGRRRHGRCRCRCRGGRNGCRAVCHAVEGSRMIAEGSMAIHRNVAGGNIIEGRMELRRRRRRRWRLLARKPMATHADNPTPVEIVQLSSSLSRSAKPKSINQPMRHSQWCLRLIPKQMGCRSDDV